MEEKNESPLNRDLQRKILFGLREKLPFGSMDTAKDLGLESVDRDVFLTNLIYLSELGLIDHGLKFCPPLDDDDEPEYLQVKSSTITARGLDFLEQDGGLSAVLGVVTVRLHDDTIKDLIAAKVMASDLEPDDKKKYLDQLKELPADATKHLVMKLVDLGVEKIPTAALGSIINSALKAFGG